MKKHDTIMIVLAEPIDGKPRAARARSEDEALVATAAKTMGYTVGIAKDQKARALAKKLPAIKIFKTGRALVPRVNPELFDQLEALLTFPKGAGATVPGSAQAVGTEDQPENLATSIPNPWGEIGVGSLVLAAEDGWDGWFEAHVVRLESQGRILVLKWRDWPKLKQFTRTRTSVAIPPSARPSTAPASEPAEVEESVFEAAGEQ